MLHLSTRLLRGGVGGEILATVEGLSEHYEFTVGYGAQFDEAQVTALTNAGARTRRFPLIRHYNPLTPVPATIAVARYLSASDFDVVQTHSTEAGVIGRWAAALAGVGNVIHTVHGVPFTDDRNVLLRRFLEACERASAPRADVLVAKADSIREAYLARGIGTPEQFRTIYSGIDVDVFGRAAPADLPGRGVRILLAARLVEGKGIPVLFEAVEAMGEGPYAVCVAGTGPIEESLQRDVRDRGLADRVHFLGFREDMPAVYAASDIFVLPSFREGLPRVVSESLAAGLPVVASRIAGIPEQVEDCVNGFLVEPGDSTELACRLADLVGDRDLRRQMGRASRRRAPTFSRERMVSDTRELYGCLLSR